MKKDQKTWRGYRLFRDPHKQASKRTYRAIKALDKALIALVYSATIRMGTARQSG